MELVIGLIVIGVLGYFAFFRKKEEVAEVAPYKVEVVDTALAQEPVKVEEVAPLPVTEAPVKKPRKPRATKAVATTAAPRATKAVAKTSAPRSTKAVARTVVKKTATKSKKA